MRILSKELAKGITVASFSRKSIVMDLFISQTLSITPPYWPLCLELSFTGESLRLHSIAWLFNWNLSHLSVLFFFFFTKTCFSVIIFFFLYILHGLHFPATKNLMTDLCSNLEYSDLLPFSIASTHTHTHTHTHLCVYTTPAQSGPGDNGNEWILHPPKLRNWNLTTRCNLMSHLDHKDLTISP